MDVVEIDAASHRGVDDIRALRETIKLAPSGSNKKVYIIDEAHMLTQEAANALLKTLEEPPPHALFILATTAPEKLPDTIRSRCTNVVFYKGGKEEILRSLKKVVSGEGIEIEEDAIDEIAKISDGSFREAHKILEQLNLSQAKIKIEDVLKVASGGVIKPQEFIKALSQKDAKVALEEIEQVTQKGLNLRSFTVESVSLLRKHLLSHMGVGEKLEDLSLNEQDSLKLIELLSEAIGKIPTSVVAQLPLEMVVARWCVKESVSTHLSPNSVSAESRTGSWDLHAVQNGDSDPLDPTSDKDDARSLKRDSSQSAEKKNEEKEVKSKEQTEEVSLTESDDLLLQVVPLNTQVENLDGQWKEIMKLTKGKNHSVEALLRACRPAGFDGRSLTVEVFYKFHKDRLEQSGYRDLVEISAQEVLGIKPIKLVCLLSQTKKRAADIVNITSPKEEELVKLAEDIFSGASDGKVH